MERSISARLTASTAGLKAALAEAGASVQGFAKKTNAAIETNRAAFSKLGTGLLAIGTVAAAGFGLAAREAIQWESAFAGVMKTVDDSAAGYARLEDDLRALALVLPASAVGIAGVAEAAGQLNVAREDIVSFTRTMIDLGETTNLSANDAATGLARFMNIIGTAPDDVGRLGATLVDLGNKGASTEAEILAMGLRIAGVATIAGLSEAEVLGLANAMSSLGLEAEAGGTAITRVFTTMDDAVKTGGANLETFAATAGVSAEQFAAVFRSSPVEALELFLDGLNDTTAAGGSLTTTLDALGLADIRVSDTLRRLSADTDGLTESVENGRTAWEDQNALVEEAAKRYETTESKLKIARNALTDAGIEIGNRLLPVLVSLGEQLANLVGWFTDLPSGAQNTILALIALGGVSALAAGAILKITAAAQSLIPAFGGGAAAAAKMTTALKIMTAATVIGGIIALAYALNELLPSSVGSGIEADVGRLSSAFFVLANGGRASGDAFRLLGGDLQGLREGLDAFAAGELDLDGFTDFLTKVSLTDQALAQMVGTGDLDEAATMIERMGLTAAETARFLPLYGAALEESSIRTEQASGKQEEAARRAAATRDEYGRLVDATGALIDPTQEMSEEAQHLADKWGLAAGSAISLAEGIDAIVAATENATDPTRDAQAANIAYEQSLTDAKQTIADLIEELKKSGGLASALADTATGFDLTSTAGQTLAQTALDIRDAAHGNADAILAVTNNTADYRAALQIGHDDLVAFYISTGKSADEAKRLADNLIVVPPVVPIEVPLTPLEAARLKAQELVNALDAATVARVAKITVETYYSAPTGYTGVRDLLPPGGAGGTGGAGAGGTGGAGAGGFGSDSFAGAGGIAGLAGIAGGPGWFPRDTRDTGGAGAQGQRPIAVDARTINHYPYRREGSDDHMRNIAKASAVGALAAAGMGMGEGTLIVKDG